MRQSDSLAAIERSIYRSTLKDGIYDITFGIVFLILAWIPVLETIGLSRFIGYSLLVASVVLFPWLAKRYITVPRMGAVEFGEKRKLKKRILLAIAGAVIVLTIPVLIMIISQNESGSLGFPIIAVFLAPLVLIAVVLLDSARLLVYAALLIAGVAESEFLLNFVSTPFNALISFGIPGAIVTVIGMTLLIKFVQKYPKAVSEIPYVTR